MKRQTLLLLFIFLNYYISGQVMKLTSGATLAFRNNITVTLDNLNLETDGTLSYSGAWDNKIVFSGNQTTTVNGTVTIYLPKIEIAKTGGAELSLMHDISTIDGGDIFFTSGLFNLNNNNIYLSPYADLYNESEASRIYGPNGGFIQKQVIANSGPANHGNLGLIVYKPSPAGFVYIRRGHQSQPVPAAGKSIVRFYDILSTNGSLDPNFRIHYFDAELNGIDENTMVMWKSPDNISWTNQGYTLRNTVNNYVENTGVDFSRWTLSAPYGAKPTKTITSQMSTPKTNDVHIDAKDLWKAWPNPADKTLYLNITASDESNAVIKILDSNGALIAIEQHQLIRGNNHLTIDIKKLPAGVYHIVGEWDNGKMKKIEKLVKL